MKCSSVAALWPASPLPHRVTAAAALEDPPALYTGGVDGSIVWWRLSPSESGPSIWPMAMLCGHVAPIAGLVPCAPAVASGPALLSACADGVLCVWSRGSGRCRRRRRLPTWAGTPAKLSPLPSSPGHVCIACACADSSSNHESGADGEAHHRRASKWAVVVVDSCTLSVLQTVCHGSLSIGPVKSMVVIPATEDGQTKHSFVLVDDSGKAQFFSVDAHHDGEGMGNIHRRSSFEAGTSISGESSYDGIRTVAVDAYGKLVALIFGSRCDFKLIDDGVSVGEISLMRSLLCNEDSSAHLAGGMFLEGDNGEGESETQVLTTDFSRKFALWNTSGGAILYSIFISNNVLKCEPLCEIPACPYAMDVKTSFRFCQLNRSLLRVESICYMVRDLTLWRPHVTVWSLAQFKLRTDGSSGGPCLSIMLGEGGFPGDLTRKPSSTCSNEAKDGSQMSSGFNSSNGLLQNVHTVSSLMVLSEDFYAPYALVYGFYNGDIEVVRLVNLIPETSSPRSLRHPYHRQIPERFFSGHTGAVICLAAHRVLASQEEGTFHRVLISGSSDCTVRIWDLDSGSLLTVMHHHISPVRQIILPLPWTYHPWNECFLSVGEDGCVALVSLQTLRVERMFPGHPSYPSMVAWDSVKGYIACLCVNSSSSDGVSVLYLWDVKTGVRERIIRGTASRSMFDHFCWGINVNSLTDGILGGTTSASLLLLPILEDASFSQTQTKMPLAVNSQSGNMNLSESNAFLAQSSKGKVPFSSPPHYMGYDSTGNSSMRQASMQKVHQNQHHPVKSSCPFSGVASLRFDLSALMSSRAVKGAGLEQGTPNDSSEVQGTENHPVKESLEERLLRFSLCFLHLWDVDHELDRLLMEEMKVCKPEGLCLASGLLGDRSSVTLMFPGLHATLELWKISSEFSAMRSLTIVSLAQRMISLSHSASAASSTLAAFYTRNFAEVADIKPPLLQLLVSFWQDPSEHVRMAARSLFHCAAPRAIPHHLCSQRTILPDSPSSPVHVTVSSEKTSASGELDRSIRSLVKDDEESSITTWLDSFEFDDWISYIWGTNQDAMASHIIAAAALAVWYPSIVKDTLAKLVVNQLVKLVMSMNELYSSTAAELLAEGMDSTWKACLGPEISHLIGDIFFQIECLSGSPANNTIQNPAVAVNIREALIGILLPSLAMADITGFLNVIEGQIWATSSDSPVHLVSLKTLIRVVRGSPRPLAPYLDKVVNYVLQTMDPGNLVMRKACLNASMVSLKEVARTFPMVALNEMSTRLAVGDAIGDIQTVTIRVYDIESVTQIKVLDASGPPGLPSLLGGVLATRISTAITALSFSPDGEGLAAFSENGLMIRWWSLGTAWWEKLSRSLVPVQCTKLIFVPPWESFSPNSSRSSIMASITGHDKEGSAKDKTRELDDLDSMKLLLQNLDLLYRLHWTDGRKVVLTRHGHELGTFQL